MEIDVGLDAMRLPHDEQVRLSVQAARLGFTRFWTTGGGDPFQVCALRWSETRQEVPGGIGTAIGVLPVGLLTPIGLALSAGALSNLTDSRFILGIGSGSSHSPDYRRTWGLRERSSLALMRAYLETIRGFVAGQSVTYDGAGIRYQNARFAIEPAPRTPVFLGALGPEMLRLGGELADGLCLSWATAPQVAWSRERIAEGAQRAGRDPSEVKVASYVRVCVDDDIDVARRAFTRALLNYALGWPGATGRPVYRIHFERMGFASEIADLSKIRDGGAPESEVIDAFPAAMLHQVGYYGPATGAAAFLRHAEGADIAIVRVVAARPGIESMLAVMEACRPALVAA